MRERPAPAEVGVWPWFWQRVTAIALFFMLGIHFLVTHFWGAPPLTFQDVIGRFRLAPAFWPGFNFLFLIFSLFHGLNGVRLIAYDFGPSPRARRAIAWSLWAVGVVTAVGGWFVLMAYAHPRS